jgi:hypothetical protein
VTIASTTAMIAVPATVATAAGGDSGGTDATMIATTAIGIGTIATGATTTGIGGTTAATTAATTTAVTSRGYSAGAAASMTRSGVTVQEVNANIRGGGLPERAVTVQLNSHSGRGNLDIVQQPSARNGYTAIIRINDPRGGAGFYDFTASW